MVTGGNKRRLMWPSVALSALNYALIFEGKSDSGESNYLGILMGVVGVLLWLGSALSPHSHSLADHRTHIR